MSCLGRVSPVLFDCLEPNISGGQTQLASPRTRCTLIMTISLTRLQRFAYYDCVACYWRKQAAVSGIRNVRVFSIGSELKSFWFRTSCHIFFGVSGSEIIKCLAVINHCAMWLLYPGVVSSPSSGIKHTLSSLNKSSETKEHWLDPEALYKRKESLLIMLSAFIIGKLLCLA